MSLFRRSQPAWSVSDAALDDAQTRRRIGMTTPEETREGWRRLLRDEGDLDALAVMERAWSQEDDQQ